ncbi:Transcription factor [Niveomyces insectorum RCEF 264]|uniref:Transcription factor n=1 Tax=Niveomyces insectorum RCEF 264 TaxID=1081102 RepID=A0A162JGE2_9HYPO|nr:Transcription factor [Niveomyces insectorum RCEF 264]
MLTSTGAMSEPNDSLRPMRKSFACDECKRRKIRCSGGDRRLQESEVLRRNMEEAWKLYLPGVDFQTALRSVPKTTSGSEERALPLPLPLPPPRVQDAVPQSEHSAEIDEDAVEPMQAPPMEHLSAEDFEFDESKDPERSIDGMAFLTADPHKSGYTGPQSGIAALKFLQSLPPYLPIAYSASPLSSLDDEEVPDVASQSLAARSRYIDCYFELYHTAYPILHEGTFRARVSGALAKPRDGSWPLLYNAVLAIGAFVSASSDTKGDIPFFKEARRHLTMDILAKGSLGYVQALTLLANYLQKRNKPNAGFILIGTAFSMALAIGLHREFGMPSTSPFTMEIRRRTWWTLFVFISGAQLALGRPAASLAGVSVQLPANLEDLELAVDMEQMPAQSGEPTVASCLIEQVKLARISNLVHDELLTHRRQAYAMAAKLEASILHWRNSLPAYFAEEAVLEPRLEFPKRILMWRGLNLRIVLNRPFLFEAIAAGAQLTLETGPIRSCLTAADECAASISRFLRSLDVVQRGFAWYATAWLMTASFVQATCLIYMPDHSLAAGWRASLRDAVRCLQLLGASLDIALRARDIIQNVLDNRAVATPVSPGSMPNLAEPTTPARARTAPENANAEMVSSTNALSSMGFDDNFAWLAQGQTGADFVGSAGGFMYGNGFDVL